MDCWEQARVVGALHVGMSGGECCTRGSTTGQETGSSGRTERTTSLFGFLACLSYNFIGCMATHLFDVELKRDAAAAHEGKAFAASRTGHLEPSRSPRPIRSLEVNLKALATNLFGSSKPPQRQSALDWLVDPVWGCSRCTSYLQCAFSQLFMCNGEVSFRYRRPSRRCAHT